MLPLDKSYNAINNIVNLSNPHTLEKYQIIIVINEYAKFHNLQKDKHIVLDQSLKKVFYCDTICNVETSINALLTIKSGYIDPEYLLRKYVYDNDLTLICYIHKTGDYIENYTPYSNFCVKINTFEELCDNIIKVMKNNDADISINNDYIFDECICEYGNVELEIYSWQSVHVYNIDQSIVKTDGKNDEICEYIEKNY